MEAGMEMDTDAGMAGGAGGSAWRALLGQLGAGKVLRHAAGLRHPVAEGYYCPFHEHAGIEIVFHPTGSGVTRVERRGGEGEGGVQEVAFEAGDVVVYAPRARHDQRMEAGGEARGGVACAPGGRCGVARGDGNFGAGRARTVRNAGRGSESAGDGGVVAGAGAGVCPAGFGGDGRGARRASCAGGGTVCAGALRAHRFDPGDCGGGRGGRGSFAALVSAGARAHAGKLFERGAGGAGANVAGAFAAVVEGNRHVVRVARRVLFLGGFSPGARGVSGAVSGTELRVGEGLRAGKEGFRRRRCRRGGFR